jgi:hypothetical protein
VLHILEQLDLKEPRSFMNISCWCQLAASCWKRQLGALLGTSTFSRMLQLPRVHSSGTFQRSARTFRIDPSPAPLLFNDDSFCRHCYDKLLHQSFLLRALRGFQVLKVFSPKRRRQIPQNTLWNRGSQTSSSKNNYDSFAFLIVSLEISKLQTLHIQLVFQPLSFLRFHQSSNYRYS